MKLGKDTVGCLVDTSQNQSWTKAHAFILFRLK
jgi:hypothetical protein